MVVAAHSILFDPDVILFLPNLPTIPFAFTTSFDLVAFVILRI